METWQREGSKVLFETLMPKTSKGAIPKQQLDEGCALPLTARRVAPDHSANLATNAPNVVQSATQPSPAKKEVNQGSKGQSRVVCPQNHLCVCCKYHSPVNLSTLIPLLQLYPEKKSAEILQSGFTEGFKLGYEGARGG